MEKRSNVDRLHNAIGSKTLQKPHKNSFISKRRFKRAVIMISVLGLALLFFGFQYFSASSQLRQVNADIKTKKVELKKEHKKQINLKNKRKSLKNDDYVNGLAHSKYGYAKKGETNYHLDK